MIVQHRDIRWQKTPSDIVLDKCQATIEEIRKINASLIALRDHPGNPHPDRRVRKEDIPELASIEGDVFLRGGCEGWDIYYQLLPDVIKVVYAQRTA